MIEYRRYFEIDVTSREYRSIRSLGRISVGVEKILEQSANLSIRLRSSLMLSPDAPSPAYDLIISVRVGHRLPRRGDEYATQVVRLSYAAYSLLADNPTLVRSNYTRVDYEEDGQPAQLFINRDYLGAPIYLKRFSSLVEARRYVLPRWAIGEVNFDCYTPEIRGSFHPKSRSTPPIAPIYVHQSAAIPYQGVRNVGVYRIDPNLFKVHKIDASRVDRIFPVATDRVLMELDHSTSEDGSVSSLRMSDRVAESELSFRADLDPRLGQMCCESPFTLSHELFNVEEHPDWLFEVYSGANDGLILGQRFPNVDQKRFPEFCVDDVSDRPTFEPLALVRTPYSFAADPHSGSTGSFAG